MKWFYCTCFTLFTLLAHAQVPRDSMDNNPLPYGNNCYGTNVILTTPSPVYACTGGTAQFIALVMRPYSSKHWEQSTDNGVTWTVVPGSSAVYSGFGGIMGTDTLTLANITSNMNGYQYRGYFRVTCNGSNVYTAAATLNLGTSGANTINITSQPTNAPNICTGANILFAVQANGPSINYQWQASNNGGINFNPIPGATTSTLNFIADTTLNNHRYRCLIQGACIGPIYSDTVTTTVYPKPNLGADSVVNLACTSCTTDISGLYNTTGYTASWNNPNITSVRPGIYRLTVTSPYGCGDTAVVNVNTVVGDTIKVCRNGAVSRITSDIVGTTYKWQVDYGNGSGFIDVPRRDGSGIVTTPYINTADIVPGYYGTQYRCKVNDSLYSRITYIHYHAFWNGNVSNSWHNTSNWGCGILPDANTDVFVTSGSVVLQSNTTVRSLTLAPGVNFSIAPGATLQVLH